MAPVGRGRLGEGVKGRVSHSSGLLQPTKVDTFNHLLIKRVGDTTLGEGVPNKAIFHQQHVGLLPTDNIRLANSTLACSFNNCCAVLGPDSEPCGGLLCCEVNCNLCTVPIDELDRGGIEALRLLADLLLALLCEALSEHFWYDS